MRLTPSDMLNDDHEPPLRHSIPSQQLRLQIHRHCPLRPCPKPDRRKRARSFRDGDLSLGWHRIFIPYRTQAIHRSQRNTSPVFVAGFREMSEMEESLKRQSYWRISNTLLRTTG
jgi:hypothetical protein